MQKMHIANSVLKYKYEITYEECMDVISHMRFGLNLI